MSVKREVVARDAMGRVTRETLPADAPCEEMQALIERGWPDPMAEVAEVTDKVAEWLVGEGWPDPRKTGVSVDGEDWEYIPAPLPPPPVHFMRATAFIEERAGPLSVAGFAARIWESGASVLQAHRESDIERLVRHAQALGALRTEANIRLGFLRPVEIGAKYLAKSAEGAAKRRGIVAPHVQAALDEMDRLTGAGHTASRAAERAAERGIGTSKAANLAAWNRRNKTERKL